MINGACGCRSRLAAQKDEEGVACGWRRFVIQTLLLDVGWTTRGFPSPGAAVALVLEEA